MFSGCVEMEHSQRIGLNKLHLSNIIQNSQQRHEVFQSSVKSFSAKFPIIIFNEKVTAVIPLNFFPVHSQEIAIFWADSISFWLAKIPLGRSSCEAL